MSSLLTDTFIDNEIRNQFGYPIMDFEASAQNFTSAKGYALRLFNNYKPKVDRINVSNVFTSEENALYVDIPQASGIRDVSFVSSSRTTLSLSDPFDIQKAMFMSGYPSYALADVMIRLDRYNNAKTVFGLRDDYFWDENVNRLILYSPTEPKDITVWYFTRYTSPSQILVDDDQLFLDIAVARMKQIVGNIRNKFGGQVPSPGSVTLQLNGKDLINEGTEELKEIKTVLDVIKLDSPIIRGG